MGPPGVFRMLTSVQERLWGGRERGKGKGKGRDGVLEFGVSFPAAYSMISIVTFCMPKPVSRLTMRSQGGGSPTAATTAKIPYFTAKGGVASIPPAVSLSGAVSCPLSYRNHLFLPHMPS